MAVSKLSQITLASSPPALTDVVVGVQTPGGTAVDLLYTLSQVQNTIGAAGTITINATTINSGTSGRVLYDNAGTVGEASNFNIVSGQPNVPFGSAYFYGGSAFTAVDSNNNIIFGINSGNFGVVTGFNNLAIGSQAGQNLTTGRTNVILGPQAGNLLTSGFGNMLIGETAGTNLTTGFSNMCVGHAALHAETTGAQNVVVGELALSTQNGFNGNVAIGYHTFLNLNGGGSVAVGGQALGNCTTGLGNTAIGANSLLSVTTHQQCAAFGEGSFQNADASNNSGFGFQVGFDLTTGDSNLFMGHYAGRQITTGRANTWMGSYQSLVGNSISNSIALSDGDANLRLDYGLTNSGAWTFVGPPIVPGYTVAGLPGTIVVGAIARVTDGTAGLVNGNVVTGGHSTPYLVWFNGSNWTVVGE